MEDNAHVPAPEAPALATAREERAATPATEPDAGAAATEREDRAARTVTEDPVATGDTAREEVAAVAPASGRGSSAKDAPGANAGHRSPRVPARTKVWLLGAISVVVVGLGVYATVIAQRTTKLRGGGKPAASSAHKATSTTGAPGKPQVPAGFVTTHDANAGFTISLPTSWPQLAAPPQSSLLASAGAQDSVLVRVIRLANPVGPSNIGDLKVYTDGLVNAGPVKVLQQRVITINGMAGYYYVYSFIDDQTKQVGVHAHYFLFQGRKMNVIVFQALPADDFAQLASTFDQVAASFQSDADSVGLPTTPASRPTAPGASTPATPPTAAPTTAAPTTAAPTTAAPPVPAP